MPTKDAPYACGPNSAAGRRGRRRSAYEAPRAAADRRTRLGGAESKRRRHPRLPAPPSRVTLLVQDPACRNVSIVLAWRHANVDCKGGVMPCEDEPPTPDPAPARAPVSVPASGRFRRAALRAGRQEKDRRFVLPIGMAAAV